jgi:hypothetical protein
VFLVQRLGAMACLIMTANELSQRLRRRHLPATQQLIGLTLSISAVDRGTLVPEVQQEPQLDTRIRDRDADVLRCSKLECAADVRMLVDVEHAPVLVVSIAPISPRLAQVGGSPPDGFLDEA